MSEEISQKLLDELHAIGVMDLSQTSFDTKKARLEQIKLNRMKIRSLKKELKREIESVKAKWDGRNSWEAHQEERELAPLFLIDQAIDVHEIYLKEVELSDLGHSPDTPVIGTRIVGEDVLGSGHWKIVSELEAWELMAESIKRKAQKAKNTASEVNERNLELSDIIKTKPKTRLIYLVFAIILMVSLAWPLAYIGITYDISSYIPASGAVVILCLSIALVFIYLNRKKQANRIEDAKRELQKNKEIIAELKDQVSNLQDLYLNAQQAIAELK